MDRLIDVTPRHRIIVHLFQLLQQHRGVSDLLGLTPLLPDLVFALRFVVQLVRGMGALYDETEFGGSAFPNWSLETR